ncbi:MAG: sulfite reductase [SAR202 cluster bacterium]|nr:sulfite reductase [SAR202 cluster bacterium]|tara:strand:+ start:74 stop:292 length:219 start_codon:yes stop_codon:yes gene_type:complete
MSMFIKLEVSPEVASNPDLVSKLVEICPVDIFDQDDGKLRIVDENEDECTLCDLCIEAAPEGAVKVIKLYED